ncbi:MAG TPA: hypothetical protein VD963_08595, partial [Phycisphaerales bacterium]|nr:hypothetical protein [Phycisphaerales bacterium]
MSMSRAVLHASPLALLALAGLAGCQSSERTAGDPAQVAGRYILSLGDADMNATSFVTGELGPIDPEVGDHLTILPLPIARPPSPEAERWQSGYAQVPASNSAMGAPMQIAVSADGTRAFVTETYGPAPQGALKLDDLPPGRTLTVIDLSDPAMPRVVETVDLVVQPASISLHPAGDLLAVATKSPNEQIVLVPVAAGGDDQPAGQPMAWPLVGLDDSEAAASTAVWSPSGDVLAVTLPQRDEVMFYEFRREAPLAEGGVGMGLAPIGGPVRVGKFPFSGLWTPDGNHFITTDLQWGPDVENFIVAASEGTLSVIRVARPAGDDSGADGEGGSDGMFQPVGPAHEVVSTVTVGVNPEGLAISPDGRYVVTANLRHSFLPEEDERLTRGGSVSLLRLDRDGRLEPVGEYDLDGMPEGIAFD